MATRRKVTATADTVSIQDALLVVLDFGQKEDSSRV